LKAAWKEFARMRGSEISGIPKSNLWATALTPAHHNSTGTQLVTTGTPLAKTGLFLALHWLSLGSPETTGNTETLLVGTTGIPLETPLGKLKTTNFRIPVISNKTL
jgi:hypothetical protein